ncbi:MptD family putative ECF transporter S component [Lachnospiraceae bacterium 62-26]
MSSVAKESNKLNGKDLMNIGIFTAIFLFVEIIVACVLGVFPMGFLLISIAEALILSIPMMLYYSRIKKFGMLLIMTIVNGIIMIVTGMGVDALRIGVFIGLLAELVLRWGKYQSASKSIISYAVFSEIAVTNYVHWLYASEEWLAGQTTTYGTDFVEGVSGSFAKGWVFPVVVVVTFVAGILGGLLGKKVLKKHFEKGGLL